MRHLSEHLDSAQLTDNMRVVAFDSGDIVRSRLLPRIVENDADYRDVSLPECLYGEQRMIYTSEFIVGHDHGGKTELGDQVGEKQAVTQRYKDTARALNDYGIVTFFQLSVGIDNNARGDFRSFGGRRERRPPVSVRPHIPVYLMQRSSSLKLRNVCV